MLYNGSGSQNSSLLGKESGKEFALWRMVERNGGASLKKVGTIEMDFAHMARHDQEISADLARFPFSKRFLLPSTLPPAA